MRITPAKRTQPEPSESSPLHPSRAVEAFEREWNQREALLASNPVFAFLEGHEIAGSPNELVVTGYGDVKINLGDLRRLVRGMR